MSANDTATLTVRIKRPLGVWILSICDGLFAGIIPVGVILFINIYPPAQQALDMSSVASIGGVLLAVSVCLAAYGAWKGNDRARMTLLVLITVHWGLIAYNNAELLLSGVAQQLDPERPLRVVAPIVRSIFWIAVNYWYFLGRRPQKFYAATADAKP